MVTRLLQLAEVPEPPDAADALALALCHWWRAPLRGAAVRRARAPVVPPRRRHRGRGRQGGAHDDRLGAGHGDRAHRHRRGAGRGRRRRVPRLRARRARCRRSHPGDAAFLFTHLHVREDAMVLYGFPTATSATPSRRSSPPPASGPSSALAMLSVHSPTALRRALLEDDLAALTMVPGVGKRTAQRLLVELKARLEVPELDITEPGNRPRAAHRGARRARRPRLRARRGARRRGAAARGGLGRGAPARRRCGPMRRERSGARWPRSTRDER